MLVHDRVTPDRRSVVNLDHAELERALGHEVPEAAAALERWPDIFWNLEIKSAAALAASHALIGRFGASHRILVSSFQHPVLVESARLNPGIPHAALMTHRPLRPAESMKREFGGFDSIRTVIFECVAADEDLVTELAGAGFSTWIYGPFSDEEHQRCRALGLGGVITDHPDLLRRD